MTGLSPFERVVRLLEDQGRNPKRAFGNSVTAHCPGPSHTRDDRRPSLKVTDSDKAGEPTVLIHCHAGCSSDEIVSALGATWREILSGDKQVEARPPRRAPLPEPTPDPLPSEADLTAARGVLASRMNGHRHREKQWSRATLEGLGCGLDGRRLVLPIRDSRGDLCNVLRYSTRDTPKMLAVKGRRRDLYPRPEDTPGARLYLVEGEPDAVSMAELGLPGVSYPGTNGFRDDHAARVLAGRSEVVVIPDCDDQGRTAARTVAETLAEAAGETGPVVRLLDLEPTRSDGFDVGDLIAEHLAEADPDEDMIGHLRTHLEMGASQGEQVFAKGIQSPDGSVASEAPEGGSNGHDRVPVVDAPDTDAVLDEVRAFVLRYVVLPEHAAEAIALWVLHTWAFDAASTTPYIAVLAPEKRAGKSRVLETVEHVVCKPWLISSVSPAALYRKIDKSCPTLLYDEGDATWAGSKETAEDLRGILNSGYRSSGAVAKCVGKGADMDVCDFRTFGPKMFAGIDKRWPETILDRSIRINMRRKKAGEVTESLYYAEAHEAGASLRASLEAWAREHVEGLTGARPAIPGGLNDRAAECWQPLFAIADLAGGEWATVARTAAVSLSGDVVEEASFGAKLLAAVKEAFDEDGADFLTTETLLEKVNANDSYPFGSGKDGELKARAFKRLLGDYGVDLRGKDRKVMPNGARQNGYYRAAFEDAWARWLDTLPDTSGAIRSPIRSAETSTTTGDSGGCDRIDRIDRIDSDRGEPDPFDTLKLVLEADAAAGAKAAGGDR